jgi:hypothetical protein
MNRSMDSLDRVLAQDRKEMALGRRHHARSLKLAGHVMDAHVSVDKVRAFRHRAI